MSTSDAKQTRRDFFAIVGELTLLSPQVLQDLAAEAAETHTLPSQLALRKGLLDATQIDIVETLQRPTETVPGYEILSVLGQGGMGVVYRARQLNLKRIVALKTVLVRQMGDSTSLQRFEHEAQAVAQLSHPHVVAAYDFGRHEGRLYFAMELVTGEDVQTLIHRHGSLDEWTAWGLVRQAAAGLAHASQQGIVHRDVKPANLLLVKPPAGFPLAAGLPLLKIADFGLARLMASANDQTQITMVNTAVGSPHYMSPEQLRGEPVDLRTDIFALGASTFHMLSGSPPQAGMALSQIIAHRMSGQAEAVQAACPNITCDSAELVAAMMAHDPRERIADYGELIRRIDALRLPSLATLSTMALPISSGTHAAPASEQPVQVTQPTHARSRFVNLKWWMTGISAVAVVLAAWEFADRGNSPLTRDLQPSGRVEELFNGQNVNQWNTKSGGWSPGKNQEGAVVLQGRGLTRRPLVFRNADGEPQPMPHYRLTFLVELNEASGAEVQFDFADDNADEKCLIVRIDRNESTLGSRSGERNSQPKTVSRRNHSSSAGPLHAIQLERQNRGWWAFVDDQFLGSVAFCHAEPAAEFRLLAEGGPAWFSDFTIEELVSPAEKSQAAVRNPGRN